MSDPSPQFDRLAIVGVGLIGGSIALAAKSRGVVGQVIGVGRSAERLKQAVDRKVIDSFVTDVKELDAVDLAVVCTPVDRIAHDVETLLATPTPPALITDAGSVKGNIIRGLCHHDQRGSFLGSHPLAGSHLTGFENADKDLFENRVCVLTPTEINSAQQAEHLFQFWASLGMHVRTMTPEAHDEVLSRTSHLPHLAAAAVATLVDEAAIELAATGYRDTTRIAAGDPDLWTAICLENADQVTASIEQMTEVLRELQEAIANGNAHKLRQLLHKAQRLRSYYREPSAPIAE